MPGECRDPPALSTNKSTNKSTFAAAATARQVRQRQKLSSPFSRTLSLTQRACYGFVADFVASCCRCVASRKAQQNPCKMGLVAVLPIFRTSIYQ
jgi:hypothetical protein